MTDAVLVGLDLHLRIQSVFPPALEQSLRGSIVHIHFHHCRVQFASVDLYDPGPVSRAAVLFHGLIGGLRGVGRRLFIQDLPIIQLLFRVQSGAPVAALAARPTASDSPALWMCPLSSGDSIYCVIVMS